MSLLVVDITQEMIDELRKIAVRENIDVLEDLLDVEEMEGIDREDGFNRCWNRIFVETRA